MQEGTDGGPAARQQLCRRARFMQSWSQGSFWCCRQQRMQKDDMQVGQCFQICSHNQAFPRDRIAWAAEMLGGRTIAALVPR